MKLTQNQIKALKEKCPKCEGNDLNDIFDLKNKKLPKLICPLCKGTGQATITIPKEWVEREVLGVQTQEGKFPYRTKIKIQKYQVNEEIRICSKEFKTIMDCNCEYTDWIKLKIISETEKEWKVCLA